MRGNVDGLHTILILLAGLIPEEEVSPCAAAMLMPSFNTWHVPTAHDWPVSQSDRRVQCALSP